MCEDLDALDEFELNGPAVIFSKSAVDDYAEVDMFGDPIAPLQVDNDGWPVPDGGLPTTDGDTATITAATTKQQNTIHAYHKNAWDVEIQRLINVSGKSDVSSACSGNFGQSSKSERD